jgi:hypothetical protein
VNRLPAVRLRIPASQSIGVVAFNGDQQSLIESVLEQARRSGPSLEDDFDRRRVSQSDKQTYEMESARGLISRYAKWIQLAD